MSHIQTPHGHKFPWYIRLLFALQRRRYGQELASARLWARTPKVFAALSLLYGALDRKSSPIEPALRSLVIVRVSQINVCEFCIDLNSATALKRGLSEAKLWGLNAFQDSLLFTEREKAALAYAEAVTSGRPVDSAFMERLKQHFDEETIIELTALIAFQNMSTRFNTALGVPAQGFCKLPEESRHVD